MKARAAAQKKAGEDYGGTNVGDPMAHGASNSPHPEPWRKTVKGGGIGFYYLPKRG